MTTEPYRILVTGWRDWPPVDAWFIYRKLWWAASNAPRFNGVWRPEQVIVVHGACNTEDDERANRRIGWGADYFADVWATRYATSEPHPAPWKGVGRAAGMFRNSHMVDLGADICLAFPGPGSRGTWDCTNKADSSGIYTRTFAWHEDLTWD